MHFCVLVLASLVWISVDAQFPSISDLLFNPDAMGVPPTSFQPLALVSKDDFKAAVTACGCPSPSDTQYTNFISRAPVAGGITTKRELAMSLANILHESDCLRAKKEYGCPTYRASCDAPGKVYCGRGYIQLTWCYNYKAASQALYNDDRLLQNPDQVEQKDDVAWDTAFWFWKVNVHNRAGVQDGKFGATTRGINGGECKVNIPAAKRRFDKYSKIFRQFRVDGTPDESGCYN